MARIEIGVVVLVTDVFKHSNRIHSVKRRRSKLGFNITIVLNPDVDAWMSELCVGQFDLGRRQGDPNHRHPVHIGQIIRQCTKPTTNVQHGHSRLEIEFVCNESHFGALGVVQCRDTGVSIVRTRVLHRRPEHFGVQVIADIVV